MSISRKFRIRPASLYLAAYLFYFLLYAVSPLTFIVSHADAGRFSSSITTVSRFDILLPELLSEKTARGEDARKQGAESFLIKKKRALLPDDYFTKNFPLEKNAVGLKQELPLIPPIGNRALVFRPVSTALTGFLLLYSGHSPPFV